MRKFRGHFPVVALAVGFGVGIGWLAMANGALRREHDRLLAENEKAYAPSADSRDRTSAISQEEMEQLQQASAEASALRERIERLRAAVIPSGSTAETSKKNEGRWKYVGLGTPANTVQSIVWAATGGDVDQLISMLAYDAEGRAAAEELYAMLSPEARRYFPNSDKLVAALIATRVPTDLLDVQQNSQNEQNPDEVAVVFRVRRAAKTSDEVRMVGFNFQRVGPEWKLLVPKSIVADFRKSLQAK